MPLLSLPLWQARGPRFLVLLLGLWVMVRVANYWPGDVRIDPPLPPLAANGAPAATPAAAMSRATAAAPLEYAWGPQPRPVLAAHQTLSSSSSSSLQTQDAASAAGNSGDTRHHWRLALLGRLAVRPGQAGRALALPFAAKIVAPGIAPALPLPRWPTHSGDRWSLSVASYWRDGRATPSLGPGGATRLGGSQSAVRLAHLVDPASSLRAYVRATHTPGQREGGQREGGDFAVGLAVRPFQAFPVDVHVEQRIVIAGGERDATLIYAAGGVDNRTLPHDFHLSAYGQAGVADFGEVVGFADAVVVVKRDVAALRGVRLALGSVAAASVQPGARRIDIGPRAALQLTKVGQGAQIALDWREQVAGNARPGSGLALTIATDF